MKKGGRTLAWMGACLSILLAAPGSSPALTPDDLIRAAGQASTEKERYTLLDSLSRHPDLDPPLRADLDRLLPIVDRWANDLKYWSPEEQRRAAENGYLCDFSNSRIRPERDFPPRVGEGSPLDPIWATYRARMLVHRPIQSGNLARDPVQRQRYSYNRDAFTNEVRYTDRLFAFNSRYVNAIRETPLATADIRFLYGTVTGDAGSPLYLPTNAVRWRTSPDGIAVLLASSSGTSLTADLYHFGEAPREMGADFYLLDPGTYRLILRDASGSPISESSLRVTGPRASVAFALPPNQACTLEVRPSS